MIKDKTKELIKQAIEVELENAKSYGENYSSDHEAIAVLFEEIQEVDANIDCAKYELKCNIWESIKNNEKFDTDELWYYYIGVVCEAVQVLACLKKWGK